MKYLPYGEINKMMPYLLRRAQETCGIFNSVDI